MRCRSREAGLLEQTTISNDYTQTLVSTAIEAYVLPKFMPTTVGGRSEVESFGVPGEFPLVRDIVSPGTFVEENVSVADSRLNEDCRRKKTIADYIMQQ